MPHKALSSSQVQCGKPLGSYKERREGIIVSFLNAYSCSCVGNRLESDERKYSQLENSWCLLSNGSVTSDVTWALEDIKSFSSHSVKAHLHI